MIDARMIPDEVVEAAAIAGYQKSTSKAWEKAGHINQQNWRRAALAALAAALNAWEGADEFEDADRRGYLTLPLPKDTADE
jgi:hypothetical protein